MFFAELLTWEVILLKNKVKSESDKTSKESRYNSFSSDQIFNEWMIFLSISVFSSRLSIIIQKKFILKVYEKSEFYNTFFLKYIKVF